MELWWVEDAIKMQLWVNEGAVGGRSKAWLGASVEHNT